MEPTVAIIAELHNRLAAAREENRQLRHALGATDAVDWCGDFRPTLTERAILNTLLAADVPVGRERLRHRMDIAMGNVEGGTQISVDVRICALRKKLAALNPPVAITTLYGRGYLLTPVDRTRLLLLRGDRPCAPSNKA